eukprot:gene4701-6811_t
MVSFQRRLLQQKSQQLPHCPLPPPPTPPPSLPACSKRWWWWWWKMQQAAVGCAAQPLATGERSEVDGS